MNDIKVLLKIEKIKKMDKGKIYKDRKLYVNRRYD